MKNKYVMPLIAIASVLVFSLVTMASYAYFTGMVRGDEPQQTVITTGHMDVTYIDGETIGTKENMIPGESVSKHFSVKNSGDVVAAYNIYLIDVVNEFVNTDELVYELISDDGINIGQTECPTDGTYIAFDVPIEVGETHEYELKITFLNTDYNQNDNQGSVFSAKISLEDGLTVLYKDKTKYYFSPDDVLDTSVDSTSLEDYAASLNVYAYMKNYAKEYYTVGNTYFYTNLESSGLDYETLEECEQTLIYNFLDDNILYKECRKDGNMYYPYLAYSVMTDDGGVEYPNVFNSKEECAATVEEIESTRKGAAIDYGQNCTVAYGDVEKPVYRDNKTELCVLEDGNEYCIKPKGSWTNPYDSNLIAMLDESGVGEDFY